MKQSWFVAHFETLWHNRHKLKFLPYADVVIENLIINGFASPYGSYCVQNIRLGDLVTLWDNGFIYKQNPLIHYSIAYGDNSIHIAYIHNGDIINRRFNFNNPKRYVPNENVRMILKKLRTPLRCSAKIDSENYFIIFSHFI